jgi:predicted nucleic-acid-binding Zn-ribbon protein
MKKKYLAIFISLLMSIYTLAQSKGFIPFRKAEKWGFADTNRTIVIKPVYDSVGFFSNYSHTQVALVANYIQGKKKMGILKTDGALILPTESDSIQSLEGNGCYYYLAYRNKKIQILISNTSEKKLQVHPIIFSKIYGISSQHIIARGLDNKLRCYFLWNNKVIDNKSFSYLSTYDTTKIIIEDRVGCWFSNDKKQVYILNTDTKDNYHYELLDVNFSTSDAKDNSQETLFQNTEVAENTVESLDAAISYNRTFPYGDIVKKEGKYGFVGYGDKILIPCEYDEIIITKTAAVVKKNNKYGIIRHDLKITNTPIYDNIIILKDRKHDFAEYFWLQLNKKWNMYDLEKEITSDSYDDIDIIQTKENNSEEDIYLKLKKGNSYYLTTVNLKQKSLATEAIYEIKTIEGETKIAAKKDGIIYLYALQFFLSTDLSKMTLIKADEIQTIKCKSCRYTSYYKIRNGQYWGLFSIIQNKEVVKCAYNQMDAIIEIGPHGKMGVLFRNTANKTGLVDIESNKIIPPEYDSITTQKIFETKVLKLHLKGKVSYAFKGLLSYSPFAYFDTYTLLNDYCKIWNNKAYCSFLLVKKDKWAILNTTDDLLSSYIYDTIIPYTLKKDYYAKETYKNEKILDVEPKKYLYYIAKHEDSVTVYSESFTKMITQKAAFITPLDTEYSDLPFFAAETNDSIKLLLRDSVILTINGKLAAHEREFYNSENPFSYNVVIANEDNSYSLVFFNGNSAYKIPKNYVHITVTSHNIQVGTYENYKIKRFFKVRNTQNKYGFIDINGIEFFED